MKKKKNYIRLRENEDVRNEGDRRNGAAMGIALGRYLGEDMECPWHKLCNYLRKV